MVAGNKEKKELSIKNPRKAWYDDRGKFFIRLRLFLKGRDILDGPAFNEIIPATSKHSAWVLGCQPTIFLLNNLFRKYPNKNIRTVNMLADRERLLVGEFDDNGQERMQLDGKEIYFSRMPWFDHGSLNLITRKNETVESMKAFQNKLHEVNELTDVFYCHCMAGRSRSYTETLAFLYYHPEMFNDFDQWLDNAKKGVSDDLKKRLQDKPSFGDIAEFVELKRSKVKPYRELDGDQSGLVGLIALDKAAHDMPEGRSVDRLLKDAQDIGLMLKAPLDMAFRDEKDKQAQEENLVKAVEAYAKKGINLLTTMIAYPESKNPSSYEEFKKIFEELNSSEQARFAILLKKLEENDRIEGLDFLRGKSSEFAKISTEKFEELTAGDQVELFLSFSNSFGEQITHDSIVRKIQYGKDIDCHNSEVQMGRLMEYKNVQRI